MTSIKYSRKKKTPDSGFGFLRNSASAVALGLCVVAPLAGCTGSPPSSAQKAQLTYDYMSPLRMDVVEVQVIDAYRPPFREPNVDHLFTNQPRDAIKKMLQNRLQPAGDKNTMRVIIEDASVVEEPVDKIASGVQGLFTRETDRRYRATVKLNVEFLSPDGIRLGGVPLRGERTHEALEGLTVNQREKLWLNMTEKLVDDINRALTDVLQSRQSEFMLSPHRP